MFTFMPRPTVSEFGGPFKRAAAMRSFRPSSRPAPIVPPDRETMKEIAGQLREVRLVVGADKLEALWPSNLLGGVTGGGGPES